MMMLTIPLVAIALFYQPKFAQYPWLKPMFSIAILWSAVHAVIFPPRSTPFVQYTNAFLSVAYVLRAVELLLMYDLPKLRRLERNPPSSTRPYAWKPIPTSLSLKRLFWVCDLIINPRAIGWSYASSAYRPPQHQIEGQDDDKDHHPHRHHSRGSRIIDENRLPFLIRQLVKLVGTYFLMDTHHTGFGRNWPLICAAVQMACDRALGIQVSPATSHMFVREYLLGPLCWLAAYSFIDGFHALIGLVDVGVLRILWPAAASEPWMYPPLFRSGLYMLTCRLSDIWGKMWHDLCRRPLLAVSSLVLTPRTNLSVLHRFLVLCLSFSVSGLLHAAGAYAVSQDVFAATMVMIFFSLMAPLIALQQLVEVAVAKVTPAGRVRMLMAWGANALVLLVWAYTTCPWFLAWSMMPEAIASIPMPVSFWGLLSNAL